MDIDEFYGHDEDEHMRAAIRASLSDAAKQSPGAAAAATSVVPPHREANFVDLTVDSESNDSSQTDPHLPAVAVAASKGSLDEPDAQLEQAIKLSLMKHNSLGSDNETGETTSHLVQGVEKRPSQRDTPTPSENPNSLLGILGMDRKKMEEERLARVGRKRKASAPPGPPVSKHAAIMNVKEDPPVKTADPPNGISVSIDNVTVPEGTVKKTWAFGYDRKGDDIKFEEVVQKSDLELAVLSSYMWNVDWMFSKFDIKKTKFLLIMGEKEEDK
ncbi:hypothetical protein ACJ72_08793, partial [Emergomyces africanus]